MWKNNYFDKNGKQGLTPFKWDRLQQDFKWLADLAGIEQEPRYHGEGNVRNHTKMVLEAALALDEWAGLSENEKYTLFAACLLHDTGKLFCTKIIDGVITSKNHARKGAVFSRRIIWQGLDVPFSVREEIVGLILLHSLPLWLHEKNDPEKTVIKASQSVSLKLLALLAEADVRGRICDDKEELLQRIELFKGEAQRLDCYDTPFIFESDAARFLYFSKESMSLMYKPYEAYKSEVILMSGLPGAGKDYWLEKNTPDLPVISLDDIRQEMSISPEAKQHKVIDRAKEEARVMLRQGRSFIWNATNITRRMRKQLVDLFVAYQAKVVIVYIEPCYETLMKQNDNRQNAVPEMIMEKMMNSLEVPAVHEAHEVKYITGW